MISVANDEILKIVCVPAPTQSPVKKSNIPSKVERSTGAAAYSFSVSNLTQRAIARPRKIKSNFFI